MSYFEGKISALIFFLDLIVEGRDAEENATCYPQK
jgi:hypothetical protein